MLGGVAHLWDDWLALVIAVVVFKVRLVQHSGVDPGCIVPACHSVQRATCQLGDAHVVIAGDLTEQTNSRQQQQAAAEMCQALTVKHFSCCKGLSWHAFKHNHGCKCVCHLGMTATICTRAPEIWPTPTPVANCCTRNLQGALLLSVHCAQCDQ